ncbi:hypothetical protein [Xaviernesmea oryzae]|uniref:hypothetical protein n=1 Tax=Xaviernesmea oryzae TaxID=464029 RepID=UPI00117BD22F|nr:hypothetical protein [Xaviernesmea oryzae]
MTSLHAKANLSKASIEHLDGKRCGEGFIRNKCPQHGVLLAARSERVRVDSRQIRFVVPAFRAGALLCGIGGEREE